jgi:hypothetical protein
MRADPSISTAASFLFGSKSQCAEVCEYLERVSRKIGDTGPEAVCRSRECEASRGRGDLGSRAQVAEGAVTVSEVAVS